MSVTFDVIGIAVRDMRASLQFYRRLGLPVPDGMEGEMHVEMSLGGIRLAWDTVEMLQDVYNGWDEPSGHCVELAFRCDTREEVDEVYERLVNEGYWAQGAVGRHVGATLRHRGRSGRQPHQPVRVTRHPLR